VPLLAAGRHGAVTGADRPIVAVGRAAQIGVPHGTHRDVQGVRSGPRRFRRRARVLRGAPADVLCHRGGLARRVLDDRVPFRGDEPERSGTLRRAVPGSVPAGAQPRQRQLRRPPTHRLPRWHPVAGFIEVGRPTE
jgi:hypothetical protein